MDENNLKEKVTGVGLEYNTERTNVLFAQYGRNTKKLVDYALTIEDRNERNLAAKQIVATMEILNPKIRFIDEYKKVLWNHLAIMSSYKLDIDYPYEIIPEDEMKSKPEIIPIQKKRIKIRQYGKIIEQMVQIAIEMEDKEKQKDFIYTILIQMKRTYIEWNKDVVSDIVIFDDFRKLSENQLEVPKNFKLPHGYELRNKYKGVSSSATPTPTYQKRNKSNNYRKKR